MEYGIATVTASQPSAVDCQSSEGMAKFLEPLAVRRERQLKIKKWLRQELMPYRSCYRVLELDCSLRSTVDASDG